MHKICKQLHCACCKQSNAAGSGMMKEKNIYFYKLMRSMKPKMGFLFIPTNSQSSGLIEHGPQGKEDMQTKSCGVVLAQCHPKLGLLVYVCL